MRVEDVPEDSCGGRCDACSARIKKRHHELVLIDDEGQQIVGRYHAAPDFGCLSAAEKYEAFLDAAEELNEHNKTQGLFGSAGRLRKPEEFKA